VRGVSFDVEAGVCTAIVGANGAGKTSILRGISGLTPTRKGTEVSLDGKRIDSLAPDRRSRAGLGHVLEGRHIFPQLSVRENLELGKIARQTRDVVSGLDDVLELFPDLTSMLDRRGASLSGGQQQFLAMARAMMGSPMMLLLDEPTVGLAPRLIEQIVLVIRRLLVKGTTVLLVEQYLEVVTQVAGDVHVLSHGDLVRTMRANDPELVAVAHHTYLS